MKNNILKKKLQTIQQLAEECLREWEVAENSEDGPSPSAEILAGPPVDLNVVLAIANKINDCDESDLIQKLVLDKRGRENKVLLCYYIAGKYFENVWLTSGDIETITSHLGIKISISNASSTLKKLQPYLESGTVRRNGLPTPYRINRKGSKRLEEVIRETST